MLTICLLFSASLKNANAEGNGNEVDIATSPHKVFFDITNAKPGDTYTKVLTVQNNGSQNFNYLFSNRFLTGSEQLYNELVLKVTDNTGVLYSGKLKDFNKLDPRSLKSNDSEELTLSVSMPYELGNSYQGLNAEFQFKFYVDGTLGGVLPVNGPKLPNTGSNMYNILVSGLALLLIGVFLQFFAKKIRKINKQQ